MRFHAKLYITAVVAAGLVCFGYAIAQSTCRDPLSYLCVLGLALGASLFKVTVPGAPTTLSVSFILVLLSIIDFSYPETLVVACLAAAAQAVWRKQQQNAVQFLFNVSSVAVAVRVAYVVHHGLGNTLSGVTSIAITAMAYFLINTFAVSVVIGLTSGSSIYKTWRECHFWLLPYYLVGAGIALLASWSNHRFGLETSALALPAAYIIYRSYRLYLDRLEREKYHAEEVADLHLRTIEALAMAIEAKDVTTHNHVQRVQFYALELGKALNVTETELQALRAGAILHDIGKLAVPEHIISKPGKLTFEEFEKMKIHPVVGAEILERVGFPYAVVPIVRSHHERWNGAGYPDGLKGEAIPLGARIIGVVDCLDALASDRQYRRALPLDEAMAVVVSESGKSYDPRVVEVLRANYREWEKLSRAERSTPKPLPAGVTVTGGAAPAAGLQVELPPLRAGTCAEAEDAPEANSLASIAAAVQEVQALYDLSQNLGNSINLHETLSVLDSRLRRLIPYDAIAVYVREADRLTPKYVNGQGIEPFLKLPIDVGQGISGWVASTGEPIVNGNPSVEPAGLNDPACKLRSALAIPLGNAGGITGVLTLYHLDRDAFTKDHLRVLLALKSKLSMTIENALRHTQVSLSARTDGLTALPNARSLFLHLDAELTLCSQRGSGLAVLLCDLDGFRHVNDRFGRLVGNNILKLVAARLHDSCRETDYVARMGGDEFVLVLPSLGPQHLAAKVKLLETMVREAGLAICGEPLLSLSIGAVSCPEHGRNAETLLAEADRRMCLAKRVRRPSVPLAARTGEWDNLSHGDMSHDKVSAGLPGRIDTQAS